MTANRVFPNSGTGTAYVGGVKDEGDKLWQYARVPLGTYGGTANAQTAVCDVPITSYQDGMAFIYQPSTSPTAAFTLNIDGIGARDVVDRLGNAMQVGLIKAGGTYELVYDTATGKLIATGVERGRVGRQNIYIPASQMIARTTNGAATGTAETATNRIMISTLDFDAGTAEYAQFSFLAPKRWNEGTMTAVFVWSHAAATAFNVIWGIQGLALSNSDAMDTAFGTAVTVTDTGGTTNDVWMTSETSAFTLSNTPNESDWLVFQVYRDAAAGGDTLDVDARLHGVMLYWTSNNADEA
jgi:hypothetical protein